MEPPTDNQLPVEIYQLRIRLLTISPMISRRVLVRSDSSIADLHMVIQCVMGWSNERLHQFTIRSIHYGVGRAYGISFIDDGRKVLLSDFAFRNRERFLYEYDMFDHWRHEIRFEKRLPFDATKTYPICLSGRGKTPPEGCGGPDHFQALRDHNNQYRAACQLAELLAPLLEDENAELDTFALRQASYWYTIDQFDCKQANQSLTDFKAGKPHMFILLGG